MSRLSLLAACLAALPSPASSQQAKVAVEVPVYRGPALGQNLPPAAVGTLLPQLGAGPSALLPPAAWTPAPAALPLPVPTAPALPGTLSGIAQAAEQFGAAQADPSGTGGAEAIDRLYSEGRPAQGAVPAAEDTSLSAAGRSGSALDRVPVVEAAEDVSFEGVRLIGRAAEYFREVKRLTKKLTGLGVSLAESLDVMDDSFGDVWSKLKGVEAVARDRSVELANTHLNGTLTWVDGVFQDQGRRVAVHTHRVFFHKAKNPSSEINEGIRRLEGYLKETTAYLAPGGKADKALQGLDEVVLVFDTRGYAQIKRHLKIREREIAHRYGSRFRFAYLDELVQMPESVEETRRQLNGLTKKYEGDGLQKIVEGVIYSRYVGLLLELKTIEYYVDRGYRILQSGRDLFDERGQYVTELDAVLQAPDGSILVAEAKSARVRIPIKKAFRDKVVYKLETYRRNRELMERTIGGPFKVVFPFDVGRNQKLAKYLASQQEELSRKYGFQVEFLFLESAPGSESAPGLEAPVPAGTPPSPEPRPAGRLHAAQGASRRAPDLIVAKTAEDVRRTLSALSYPHSLVLALAKAVGERGPMRLWLYRDGRGRRYAAVDLEGERWVNRLPGLTDHERSVIRKVLARGAAVQVLLPENNGKTPDLIVDGTITEIKGIKDEVPVGDLLDKANEQVLEFGRRHGAAGGDVILDIMPGQDLTADRLLEDVRRWADGAGDIGLRRVWVYSGSKARSLDLQGLPSEPPSPRPVEPQEPAWKRTLREVAERLTPAVRAAAPAEAEGYAAEIEDPPALLVKRGVRTTVAFLGSARFIPEAQARRRYDELVARLGRDPGTGEARQALERARQDLENSHWYEEARTLAGLVARRLGKDGAVVTGGGGGIMEAANRGASEAGGLSVGFNIRLPQEQRMNSFVTPGLGFEFQNFPTRELNIRRGAASLVYFPGGYGTMYELFETLTHMQTGKAPRVPLVFIGPKDYLENLRSIMESFARMGVISPADLRLVTFAGSAEEAWPAVERSLAPYLADPAPRP